MSDERNPLGLKRADHRLYVGIGASEALLNHALAMRRWGDFPLEQCHVVHEHIRHLWPIDKPIGDETKYCPGRHECLH